MKRYLYMNRIILVFFLCITILGCSEESSVVVPIPPVVEQPKIYTTTFTIKGVGVEKVQTTSAKSGEIVSFKAIEYLGYTRTLVLINDIPQSLPLSETYNITVVSDVKIIFEYKSNYFLILSNGADTKTNPWRLKNFSIYDEKNNFKDSLILTQTPERLTNKIFYYSNGKYEQFNKELTQRSASGDWYIDGEFFVDGLERCPIIELTAKKFVYDGAPITQPNGVVEHKRITEVRD